MYILVYNVCMYVCVYVLEMQKSKMAVWGGLTNSCEEKWKAKEKRKDILIWIQSSKE